MNANLENIDSNVGGGEDLSLRKTNYHIADSLGEGSFGAVRTVYDDDGNQFAMKEFEREKEDVQEEYSDSEEEEEYEEEELEYDSMDLGTLREISVLRMFAKLLPGDDKIVEHPGVMRLHDIYKFKGNMCMIMPKYSCNLAQAITGNALTGKKKLECAHKLISTLAFLHTNHIIHRDVKCDNVLMDDDMNPVLADFSLAKLASLSNSTTGTTHTPGVGTACYKAPEVYKDQPYGLPADVFSLGVVLVEIFMGLMSVDRDKAALKHMEGVRAKLSSKPIPALLKAMLDPDPKTRITCEEALKSPVFAKFQTDVPITQVIHKVVPVDEVKECAHSKNKKKREKKKGKKKERVAQRKKKKKTDRGEDQLRTLLELQNDLTFEAARKYKQASGESLEHCVVLAAKMYEPELLGMSFVEDSLDEFDCDEYANAELNIFKAMDWCLFI